MVTGTDAGPGRWSTVVHGRSGSIPSIPLTPARCRATWRIERAWALSSVRLRLRWTRVPRSHWARLDGP